MFVILSADLFLIRALTVALEATGKHNMADAKAAPSALLAWVMSCEDLLEADRKLLPTVFENNAIYTQSDVKLLTREDLVELKVPIGLCLLLPS